MKRLLGLAAIAIVGLCSTQSSAHGPTVRITPKGLEPALLNLFLGSTVHFTNELAQSQGAIVCIDEACRVRSPVLKAPGDGWHYTFDALGSHAIRLEGKPEAAMKIVIVPKKPGMP